MPPLSYDSYVPEGRRLPHASPVTWGSQLLHIPHHWAEKHSEESTICPLPHAWAQRCPWWHGIMIDRGARIGHPSNSDNTANFAVFDSQPWLVVARSGIRISNLQTIEWTFVYQPLLTFVYCLLWQENQIKENNMKISLLIQQTGVVNAVYSNKHNTTEDFRYDPVNPSLVREWFLNVTKDQIEQTVIFKSLSHYI